ncbi:pilus assembly PilX N-terminal domain-containing protein [PVC group bacterium]|nr:pilus assembly PilX N-terminal domain-containing protein [PVC group bacterium]
MKKLKNESGSVLVGTILILTIAALISGNFMVTGLREERQTEALNDSNRALYSAEAGLEQVTQDIETLFRAAFYASDWDESAFTWFDTLFATGVGYTFPTNTSLDAAGTTTYTVTLTNVVNAGWGIRELTLNSVGVCDGQTRTVQSQVRYFLGPSQVFDYAYFASNYGDFGGGGVNANGSIRTNGDWNFGGSPTINGDVYASVNAKLGADGSISGNYSFKTYDQYQSYYNGPGRQQTRPTNPTDNSNPVDTYYEFGYDGSPEFHVNEDVNFNGVLDPGEDYDGDGELDLGAEELVMPRLKSDAYYKAIAVSEGGTIFQAGVPLVTAVYDSSENGPDGISGTPDDGSIVLIGTVANPIVINGPVWIDGDVLISGVISGQGTIYSGRNTHILGDITYADPPLWNKPDANPDATATLNATKDMLGLVARGSMIVGDYTENAWQNDVLNNITPPYTQQHDVDALDAANGYIDGWATNGILDYDEDTNGNGVLDAGEDQLRPYFDGDYDAVDGGFMDDGTGSPTARKFYESSMGEDWIDSNADKSSQIRNIDAVMFSNHLYAGSVGAFKYFGSMISRDAAFAWSGSIELNFDPRLATLGLEFLNIYLPYDLMEPLVIGWREGISQ